MSSEVQRRADPAARITKKRKVTHRSASPRLMAELPRISSELLVTGLFAPNTGRLGSVDAAVLRELGAILHNVQCGADARKLFQQDKRTKPKKNGSALAFVYYYMRACSPDFSESQALEKIKAAERLGAPRSDASIRKTAQRHRDKTLDLLESMSRAKAGEMMVLYTADTTQMALLGRYLTSDSFTPDEDRELQQLFSYWRKWELTPDKVAGLRKYLKKKSPHIRD